MSTTTFSSRNKKNIMWIPPLICCYENIAPDKVHFPPESIYIFLFSPQNHIFWYSLEAPHWGTSYEYPQNVLFFVVVVVFSPRTDLIPSLIWMTVQLLRKKNDFFFLYLLSFSFALSLVSSFFISFFSSLPSKQTENKPLTLVALQNCFHKKAINCH